MSDPPIGKRKGRIRTADITKGIAIVGVVALHFAILQAHGTVSSNGITLTSFKAFPYSLMAMFIVISGYFFVPGRSFVENMRKRILRFSLWLAGAIIVLNTAMYLILLAQGYDLEPSQLWEVIWKSLVGKGAFTDIRDDMTYGAAILAPFEVTHALYFLQLMIVGYVILYAIADFVVNDDRKILISAFLLITVSAVYVETVGILLPFYAHMGPMAAGFLLIGVYLSRKDFYGWLENGPEDRKYWIIFFVCLAVGLLLCLVTPRDVSMMSCNFGDYGVLSFYTFTVQSLAAGIAISFILSWLARFDVVYNSLGKVGEYCIWVYVLHMFVGRCFVAPFVTFDTESWFPLTTLQGIGLTLVTVALITVLAHVFYTHRMRKLSSGQP